MPSEPCAALQDKPSDCQSAECQETNYSTHTHTPEYIHRYTSVQRIHRQTETENNRSHRYKIAWFTYKHNAHTEHCFIFLVKLHSRMKKCLTLNLSYSICWNCTIVCKQLHKVFTHLSHMIYELPITIHIAESKVHLAYNIRRLQFADSFNVLCNRAIEVSFATSRKADQHSKSPECLSC